MRKTSPPTREAFYAPFRTQSEGSGHVDVRSFAQREVFTLQSLGTHLPVIAEPFQFARCARSALKAGLENNELCLLVATKR